MIDTKIFRIRFYKIDGFIGFYDGSRYLVLFYPENYDVICNRIKYLISLIGGIAYVSSHNHANIKSDSYDSLALGKTLTLHNVIILITSVFNKDQSHYYYNIFLEKCSNKVKVAKEEFYSAIRKIWDVHVHNIVISKLVETKNNSK